MLILEMPWTRQPPAGVQLSPLAKSLGFDFAWSAAQPMNVLAGTPMFSSGPIAPFMSGLAVTNGYSIVNGTVPSMHTTTWTEIGVVVFNGTVSALMLSARTTGQVCNFSAAGLDATIWNVASVTIGGAIPLGVTNYVVTRNGSAHAFYRNGVLFGTASNSSTPGASAGYLPAIGAQGGTGPNAGAAPLSTTTGILLVMRTQAAISGALAASLSANPWQLFAPQQIIITTPAAAGYTHPTLSLATATEIGATSFKPRVTYEFT